MYGENSTKVWAENVKAVKLQYITNKHQERARHRSGRVSLLDLSLALAFNSFKTLRNPQIPLDIFFS